MRQMQTALSDMYYDPWIKKCIVISPSLKKIFHCGLFWHFHCSFSQSPNLSPWAPDSWLQWTQMWQTFRLFHLGQFAWFHIKRKLGNASPCRSESSHMNQAKWDTSDFSGMTEMDGAHSCAQRTHSRDSKLWSSGVTLSEFTTHTSPVTRSVLLNWLSYHF